MAIARCKVRCITREEREVYYTEPNPEHAEWERACLNGENLARFEGGEPPKSITRSAVVSPPTEKFPEGMCARNFTFGGSFPQTGVPENERFWEASPSLDFKLFVQNAAVDFEPGRHYYIDFVRINPADQ